MHGGRPAFTVTGAAAVSREQAQHFFHVKYVRTYVPTLPFFSRHGMRSGYVPLCMHVVHDDTAAMMIGALRTASCRSMLACNRGSGTKAAEQAATEVINLAPAAQQYVTDR
jgi:hypothetical protein